VGSCLAWVVACGSSESDGTKSGASDAGRSSGASAGRVASEAGQGGTSTLGGAGRAGTTGDAGTSTFGGMGGGGDAAGRSAAGGADMAGTGGAGAGTTSADAGAGASSGEAGASGMCSDAPLTVLFLVDTSTSMNEAYSSGNSKWDITSAVVATAIQALPNSSNVGLMFFPNVPQGHMPCFNGSLAVPFAPLDDAQRAAWLDAFARTQPEGGTPTLDAYSYAEQQIAPWASAGPTAIVFVTDGLPSYGLGCSGEGLSTEPVDWTPLQAMVDSAAQTGTYTLAVAAPSSPDNHEMLSAIATAGQPPGLCARNTTPECFFDLDVSFDLAAWLADSLPLAGSCTP